MTALLHLGGLVARGPLATVHRGSLAGRTVAVKRARAEVPGAAGALRREARILRSASHPSLVPVLDVLEEADGPALVLGWADGGSLDDLLADGPLGGGELIHLLRPVGEALDALHRAGVAHLDVSSRNVLLAASGPLLIDPAPPGAGTPGFADPAVAAGGLASARSDVFGLAACAHLALTGRHVRDGGGVTPGSALPEAVAAALAAALDPDPRRRPPSAPAFVDRLEAALGPGASHGASAPGRPSARAVARRRPETAESARTWPFERWQEEADAAAARRQAAAGATAPARRRWRWRRGKVRSSVPDDPRRPHAARPPPTTTPGGNP